MSTFTSVVFLVFLFTLGFTLGCASKKRMQQWDGPGFVLWVIQMASGVITICAIVYLIAWLIYQASKH